MLMRPLALRKLLPEDEKMKCDWLGILSAALVSTCVSTSGFAADEMKLKAISDAAIKPVMDKYGIPGMAVAITVDGENHIFNYGVVSKDTGRPVTATTMFELGSISKTFTVTLTSYAEAIGRLGCECALSGERRIKVIMQENVETSDLYRLALEHSVQIRRLNFKRDSLEDIFLKAMDNGNAPAAGGSNNGGL